MNPISGEICGLKCGDRGRSCARHIICGSQLKVGDIVKIVYTIVEVPREDGQNGVIAEGALRAILLEDGQETCTVGFMPRACVRFGLEKYGNKYCRIMQLYEDSHDVQLRRRSHESYGIASFTIIDTFVAVT